MFIVLFWLFFGVKVVIMFVVLFGVGINNFIFLVWNVFVINFGVFDFFVVGMFEKLVIFDLFDNELCDFDLLFLFFNGFFCFFGDMIRNE